MSQSLMQLHRSQHRQQRPRVLLRLLLLSAGQLLENQQGMSLALAQSALLQQQQHSMMGAVWHLLLLRNQLVHQHTPLPLSVHLPSSSEHQSGP